MTEESDQLQDSTDGLGPEDLARISAASERVVSTLDSLYRQLVLVHVQLASVLTTLRSITSTATGRTMIPATSDPLTSAATPQRSTSDLG